jgi:hypothetical protein
MEVSTEYKRPSDDVLEATLKELLPKEVEAYKGLKELAIDYVTEKVENTAAHEKFLEPSGLVRLCRAREWDVKKSFEMFVKWVNWRLEYKADQIDPNSIKSLLLKETMILHGCDKARRLCIIIRPKFHNPGS